MRAAISGAAACGVLTGSIEMAARRQQNGVIGENNGSSRKWRVVNLKKKRNGALKGKIINNGA
jgi:hypothetical protein